MTITRQPSDISNVTCNNETTAESEPIEIVVDANNVIYANTKNTNKPNLANLVRVLEKLRNYTYHFICVCLAKLRHNIQPHDRKLFRALVSKGSPDLNPSNVVSARVLGNVSSKVDSSRKNR